ncbi:hypothetical protein D6779_04040 [Candidatus Parcubacteria bacterium]|nr:MAG: hypothetical protein D6779_04040 [Candidatus Parcubacteria bacterium]
MKRRRLGRVREQLELFWQILSHEDIHVLGISLRKVLILLFFLLLIVGVLILILSAVLFFAPSP